jgi:hypothetical protein
MSTVKANAYLDASGGNNATINGLTPITGMQKIATINLNGLSLAEFTGIPASANTVILTLNAASLNTNTQQILVQLGTAGGYVSNSSVALSALSGTTSVVSSGTGHLIWVDSASYFVTGKMTFTKYEVGGSEGWVQNSAFAVASNNIEYGASLVTLSAPLTKLKVFTTGGAFDGGAAYVSWEA